jgi:hypothetical protein
MGIHQEAFSLQFHIRGNASDNLIDTAIIFILENEIETETP